MQCPADRSYLDSHSSTNDLGVTTTWSSCSTCGGVWSDTGSVNFLDQHVVYRKKTPGSYRMAQLLCPVCKYELERSVDENIPPNVNVWRCKNADGYFFPDNELQKLKAAQGAKLSYYKLWQIPLSSPGSIMLMGFSLLILGAGILLTYREVQRSQMNETVASSLVVSQQAIYVPENGEVIFTLHASSTGDMYVVVPQLKISQKLTPATDNTYWTNMKLPAGAYTYHFALERNGKRFVSVDYTVTLNEETENDFR